MRLVGRKAMISTTWDYMVGKLLTITLFPTKDNTGGMKWENNFLHITTDHKPDYYILFF
jgi:hypothetical protein